VLAVGVYVNRQGVYDWLKLYNYSVPANISALATATTMNNKGQHIFYVQHQTLDDKAAFNNHCSKESEHTIVLGCYHPPQNGIYVYDVEDARLSGVEEVTAAHEMLHAAYDRLSKGDKRYVNDLINKAYASVTNERIRSNIELYKQAGDDVTNELHSILGTEVRSLPAELEQYYKRYFNDRLKVVAFSEQYEQAFTARKNQIAGYDQQLASLKQQIDQNEVSLKAQSDSLKSRRAQLDSWLANKQYDAYNSGVADFNRQVNAYNAVIDVTEGMIANYNQLVKERNSIAAEEEELYKALDSQNLAPAGKAQ